MAGTLRNLTAAAAALTWCASAEAQAPPAEAYGRLPAIQDAAISPDGTRLAMIVGFPYTRAQPDRELTAFSILNMDTGQFEHTFAPPERNTFRGVGWADARRPYYVISAGVRPGDLIPEGWGNVIRGRLIEYVRIGVFSLDRGESQVLMQDRRAWANVSLASLSAPIEGDPGYGRMVAWGGVGGQRAEPRLTVYRVDLDRGAASELEIGGVLTRGFMLDETGAVVARVDINERADRWGLYVYDGSDARLLIEDVSEMGLPLRLYGLLDDGRIAAVNPHEDGARDVLVAIDPRTGESEPLHGAGGSDVGVVLGPWRRRVRGVYWIDDLPRMRFFDPGMQAILEEVEPLFADGYVTMESWSRDRSRVLLFGERAADAGGYYVYEPASRRLLSVGSRYPELGAPAHLGQRQSIQYRARDGVRVPAYLTLPAGVEPQALPLVLLVHGGPHARDTFAFDWWASFLASRGYAVLQPNYRGSTGYGYEWFDAGRGGWGDGVMQTDVEDGMDALVAAGMVDRARVCIVGGSYGGYAALAGATLAPERYACAVSVNGLSDPIRLLNEARAGEAGSRGMAAEWWRRSMGADDMAHLRRVTPIDHADSARAPVLLIHGDEDSVVPVQQSRTMAARLRRAGKDVRYVELDGDDHWLSSAATRTVMLAEIEAFLAEHIGAAQE